MEKSESLKTRMAVHAVIPSTSTNGPGLRYGIWVQGCGRGCPGCFNPRALPRLQEDAPDFKAPAVSGWIEVGKLVEMIRHQDEESPVEGLSMSGGEPFDQPEALRILFEAVRDMGMSVLVFTGYTIEELRENSETRIFFEPEMLVDVLVDGPYVREEGVEGELRGSENQRIHLMTERYTVEDLDPPGPLECIINPDGSVSVTGFTRAPFQDGI